MPLADCLRPFNRSDRHKVQPLINELRQAVGDDHLLGIQTELFEVLVKIVGNLPLSSGSGYFWPGSYIDFSLKLSSIALNLLRQRIQFFTMPLAQKEFETQLLKLLVPTICFFFNLRITAMTFCVAAENGDEFRFEVPYKDWFKEHEGQELTLYHNVDPDPEAASGNINRLVLKYLPESLQKRFAKSFKRGYLALLSKFIRGDVGSIVKDEFILILISQAESILRAFEEAKEKFDCEFNVKKKQAKNKKAKSEEAPATAASEEAPAETNKSEEAAKEMSNTNLIVVQKSEGPSVPTIQTSHAIKASCKLVFNALCHDTSRFFKGVGECFSVHSWLAKRGYRLVKIDSEESSPSNAQKKSKVKQITCENKKADANEENSSLIGSPTTEVSVTEMQTTTTHETLPETAAVEPATEKSFEGSKTAASGNTAPVPAEKVDQTTTEESTKISKEVANPELQQQLVQRLNESVEKSSIHPEKLADMEMDAEIKRLTSLKNKDKSDNLSNNKTSQEANANSKENAAAKTWAQFVAQQTKPSSSNAQSKSDKPSDSKNPSVGSPSETSSATDVEKPKEPLHKRWVICYN